MRALLFAPMHAVVSGILLLLFPLQLFPEITVDVQETKTWSFRNSGVSFSNEFSGARLNQVQQVGEREFRIRITPENSPVNNSAWYAFEVSSRKRQTIQVTLTYENGRHRYRPKISDDGLTWEDLDDEKWQHDRETNRATLTLDVGPEPIRIAGQEMIGTAELWGWIEEMAQKTFVRKATIGRSILGNPIEAISIGSPEARNYVYILGRQHPPEITGSLGLIHFVEHVAGSSDSARRFRESFQTIVIPLINPDGVDRGHWRHNMAGVDLNRDWQTFDQPETSAVRDLLENLAANEGARPFLLLDFHSTHRDVFYTQNDEHPTFPENFTANWLAAIRERMPHYEVRRSGSHSPNYKTSKGWGYDKFGIPSITYEFGDNTNRNLIRELATVSAEEMIRLLLAELDVEVSEESVPEETVAN